MRLTVRQLRSIIKEVVETALTENRSVTAEKAILADLKAMKYGTHQMLGDTIYFGGAAGATNRDKFIEDVTRMGYHVKQVPQLGVRVVWF